jgi:hypothetical protein
MPKQLRERLQAAGRRADAYDEGRRLNRLRLCRAVMQVGGHGSVLPF